MPAYWYVIETSVDDSIWMPHGDDPFGAVTTDQKPQEAADAVLADRLDGASDDEAHGYWRCRLWEGPGPMPPADALTVARWQEPVAVWSVVRGDVHTPDAIHPAPAGLEVPDEVVFWAMDEGLDVNDADMALLVTLSDRAKPIPGEVASLEWPATRAEADIIAAALAAADPEEK